MLLKKVKLTFLPLTSVAILVISCYSFPAVAQTSQPLCYMITRLGKILDLSDSSCESKSKQSTSLNDIDRNFIDNYKHLSEKYAPEIKQLLVTEIQTNALSKIDSAKGMCQRLRYGGTGLTFEQLEAIVSNQAVTTSSSNNFKLFILADLKIISDLATAHYCPEYTGVFPVGKDVHSPANILDKDSMDILEDR